MNTAVKSAVTIDSQSIKALTLHCCSNLLVMLGL